MKKAVSIILLVCIIYTAFFLLTGCCSTQSLNEDGRLNIVATIFPYYDFARNITADKAEIKLMLSPGNEPHSYEPSPSDIVAIENCDIFIYNGGESDEWVESVLESLQNKNIKILKMIDYITPKFEKTPEHTDGDEYDEHIWTSVRNAKQLSSVIVDAVIEKDEQNRSYYSENEEIYLNKLDELDNDIKAIVNSGKQDTIVFGDRFPFLYFVDDYGLNYECAFPGCSHETEPNISTVTRLIDYVRDEKIPVVFYLEFSNGKTAGLISEDSEAKMLQFSSCHNVTKTEFENDVSYIYLMRQNAENLREALQ